MKTHIIKSQQSIDILNRNLFYVENTDPSQYHNTYSDVREMKDFQFPKNKLVNIGDEMVIEINEDTNVTRQIVKTLIRYEVVEFDLVQDKLSFKGVESEIIKEDKDA